MKFLIVFAASIACACAATAYRRPNADGTGGGVIITSPGVSVNLDDYKASYEITPEGNFRYNYETPNGIYGQAEGVLKNVKSEYPALEIKGANKYTSPEGQVVELAYTADENGFQPQGSHLPVGPEIPEAIVRSLAYIAAHPPTPSTYQRKVRSVEDSSELPASFLTLFG